MGEALILLAQPAPYAKSLTVCVCRTVSHISVHGADRCVMSSGRTMMREEVGLARSTRRGWTGDLMHGEDTSHFAGLCVFGAFALLCKCADFIAFISTNDLQVLDSVSFVHSLNL